MCEFLEENILFNAQYVEYKLAHWNDKATESLSGFVTVLPGAYSMVRWEAVKGKPLRKLFEKMTKVHLSPLMENVFLAED